MVTMTLIPQSRPMTLADLDGVPDDGHRYELIDGVLLVTPSPRFGHQDVVKGLLLLLEAACPADLVVVVAPFNVVLADDTVMQPDLLVARFADITDRNLPTVPRLAIEVASPSTRLFDLNTKKAKFDEAGIEAFWVVDPEALWLRVWERRDGQLVEMANVSGEETFTTEVPFPVEVTPALLRRAVSAD